MKQNIQSLIDMTITDTVISQVSGHKLTHLLRDKYNTKNFQAALPWRFKKYVNEIIHNSQ